MEEFERVSSSRMKLLRADVDQIMTHLVSLMENADHARVHKRIDQLNDLIIQLVRV
jgi:hypothetical protein